jgi:hypothetical protein
MAEAPTKFIDIKDKARNAARAITPDSLAYYLGFQDIPPAQGTGIDPRRLPFNDIPLLLRDQRQASLANPPQNNPFSIFGAIDNLNRVTNTPK